MALVIETPTSSFDMSAIKPGNLCWAKREGMDEAVTGFISAATADELIVQYHPDIGNVTNHAIISISDVIDGKWQIRWSSDLVEIHSYPDSAEEEQEVDDDI